MSETALGPLLVDVPGLELSADDRDVLRHPRVGGVILFSNNYDSPGQLQELIASIKALRQTPLLVTVDHEGGRVQRFRDGFTALPPARSIGQAFEKNPQEGVALARSAGWLMAAELRAVGVDLSFAPVLDLDRGVSSVIGDRAFHSRPEAVMQLAGAYAEGMMEAGMAACGKHFPGHGGVMADSHQELPVDERDMEDLRENDLVPFEALIRDGVASMMVAHVRYSRMTSEPASLSRFWIGEVLRNRMGFNGAVFCDDLSMNGAAVGGDYPDRVAAALMAGCEMLPVCGNRQGVLACLDADLPEPDRNAAERLSRLRGQAAQDPEALRRSERWSKAATALSAL